MARGWTRTGVKLAIENLGDEVVWNLEQILACRRSPRWSWLRHSREDSIVLGRLKAAPTTVGRPDA